jgi:murein DD-endopeptidase MepM/ murein hydrolase activator NlpD
MLRQSLIAVIVCAWLCLGTRPLKAGAPETELDGLRDVLLTLGRQYREPLDVAGRLLLPDWSERVAAAGGSSEPPAPAVEPPGSSLFTVGNGAIAFEPLALPATSEAGVGGPAQGPETLSFDPPPPPPPTPRVQNQPPQTLVWRWPTTSRLITDAYGVPRGGGYHGGIDIADRWKASVAAVGPGVVEFAGNQGATYGLSVLIRHPNGWQSRYAHLSGIYVRRGDRVAAGQLIGQMGDSGYAFGTHLHLEILVNGRTIDPLTVLPRN